MKFRTYAKYKPSGLEWLGHVPEHWQVVPTKAASSWNDDVLGEDTNPEEELQYVDISSVDATAGILRVEQMTFQNAPSRARRKVRHGDVIVSTVRTYLRAIASIQNPDDKLVVSTGFAVLRPKNGLRFDFASYLFRSNYFIDEVIARSTGVSYPAINASDLVQIRVAIPLESEQEVIASFLDRETAKIDTLISKQEKLIELLKEKRQAVISHAVTKGLDPNVPMKPSGVEWLGDVPEHWTVLPSKRVFRIFSGFAFKSEFFAKGVEGYPCLITPGSFNPDGGLYFSEASATYYTGEYREEFLLEQNDLVIVMTDLSYKNLILGRAEFVQNYGLLLNQRVGKICVDESYRDKVARNYLRFLLNSHCYREQLIASTTGSTVNHTSTSKIEERLLLLPPFGEQVEIASYVEEQLLHYSTVIEKSQKQIELLMEHRTALISAAVTGKIDVRGVAEDSQKVA